MVLLRSKQIECPSNTVNAQSHPEWIVKRKRQQPIKAAVFYCQFVNAKSISFGIIYAQNCLMDYLQVQFTAIDKVTPDHW